MIMQIMEGKTQLEPLLLTLYHSSPHCAGSHRANPRRGHDHEHHWRSPHLRNHYQLHHVLPRAGRVLVAPIRFMWAICRIGNGVSVKHRRMSRYWKKPVYSYVSYLPSSVLAIPIPMTLVLFPSDALLILGLNAAERASKLIPN
jgi:hypothetical protein